MATIACGFVLPHVPLLASRPNAAPAASARKVWAAFEHITERLRKLEVDTIVTVGDDHCMLFSPQCIPQCLIAVGDVVGPKENWLGLERVRLPTHEALASHVFHGGQSDGIGWAFSKDMTVDHAAIIPYHFCYRHVAGARVIPVYLNATVSPVISSAMARRVGASIGAAIESWPGDERVAVIGTGGISHWVGMADMGCTNERFDREVLSMVEAGSIDALVGLDDDYIVANGGNGALEIKNWICAMAAIPGSRGELIAYEPVPEWVTGIGFAELKGSA